MTKKDPNEKFYSADAKPSRERKATRDKFFKSVKWGEFLAKIDARNKEAK